MNKKFWQNKRIFLTGHTGFKGSWLTLWLKHLEAIVTGYALAPNTEPSLFDLADVAVGMQQSIIGDINDFNLLRSSLEKAQPEIVFHLAAQPLVRESYLNPLETYQTNVIGTANVLEICRHIPSIKVIVVITTDKCYENRETDHAYREDEALGGYDPYSSSKAGTELVVSAYRNSFFRKDEGRVKLGLASARAGNVIGGGDFSKDRLIPDFIRALVDNQPVHLRYPEAIRPWQHVLEPLRGYLMLAEALWHDPDKFSQAWNFGPYRHDVKTVAEIIDLLIHDFGKGSKTVDVIKHPHEAHFLKLDIQKAERELNWHPQLNIEQALNLVKAWYKTWLEGSNMLDCTLKQINNYTRNSIS
jgi:CDP-glucose 4,6-dehydratase